MNTQSGNQCEEHEMIEIYPTDSTLLQNEELNMTLLIFFKSNFFVSHPHPFLHLLKNYPSIYRYANKGIKYMPKEELLLTRLCYHEPNKEWTVKTVFKGIFQKKPPIETITVIHAPNVSPDTHITKLFERESYYKRWYLLSFLGLPFSMLFTILPGPNVVLLYNLFRLYSYKHSFDGLNLLRSSNIQYEVDEALANSEFEEISDKYDLE
eukprot:NODE_78_length_23230_cov_1.644979.p11 type:complete len:209 gc:universal NODE_78_length_23230_cov_1.644979:14874-14248(-)